MGIYLNPGNSSFRESICSQIYVDKTGMIEYTNQVLGTKQKFICVSRPRRFGKSMAAEMLAAYYDKSCKSLDLFQNLEIAKSPSFQKHLNQYSVLHLDIQWFRSNSENGEKAIELFQKDVIGELKKAYPSYVQAESSSLPMVLADIHEAAGEQFVIIIDEWDCLFREDKHDEKAQKAYLSLLRGLFKGAQSDKFIKLAYMTGILPIKKYGTESALNNFKEFTMVNPGVLAKYVGFTENEVRKLCERYKMDFSEARRWYDGYRFRKTDHIYSPKSVIEAMLSEEFDSYWTNTETYESLKIYINMNFDGLRDAIVMMLGGGTYKINSRTFQNDMTTFKNKDDVLTLLVHLGYLAYDFNNKEVFIPNMEVEAEFADAIVGAGWDNVARALSASEELLKATLNKDASYVAAGIEAAHMANTSILNYNDENALSCIISLAYYSAKTYYILKREFPSGKGFADIIFIPRKTASKPAIIVELKWDASAQGALQQIKEKQYVAGLEDYHGPLLLVGINYDKKSKQHNCVIEEIEH